MSPTLPQVTIYTDGGCDPNPGPGGWAAVLITPEGQREISGRVDETTNNRMELTAAVQALSSLAYPAQVTVYTDSTYLQRGIQEWMPNWIRRNWRGSSGPVANQDLWKELLAAAARHQVEWRWVRAHSGNPLNEKVDRLVQRARSGKR